MQAFARFRIVATVEEHSLIGGLGSAVAEWLVDRPQTPAGKAAAFRHRRSFSARGRRSGTCPPALRVDRGTDVPGNRTGLGTRRIVRLHGKDAGRADCGTEVKKEFIQAMNGLPTIAASLTRPKKWSFRSLTRPRLFGGRMKYLILFMAILLTFFAVPCFLPSEEARDKALKAGFTPEEIQRGREYSFQRQMFFWPHTLLHLALLTFLVSRSRRTGGRLFPLGAGLVAADRVAGGRGVGPAGGSNQSALRPGPA